MSLSSEDQQQLLELLKKAHASGVKSEELHHAVQVSCQSPPASENDFFVVSSGGAMTDAAKRREMCEGESKNSKRAFKTAYGPADATSSDAHAGYPIQWEGDIPGYEGGSYVAPGVKPTPFPSPQPDLPSPKLESEFPEGITSLSQWGRTIVSFGQYNHQNVSYFDLISSTEARKANYVKWCKSHGKTAGGFLKDFCNYIQLFEATSGENQGPKIPGTGHVRSFKS